MAHTQTAPRAGLLPLLLTALLLLVSSSRGARPAPLESRDAGDACAGRRIYTLPLPRKFHVELLYSEEKDSAIPPEWWTRDMVKHLQRASANAGFGKGAGSLMGVEGLSEAWFQTDQNTLENIFHARMNAYPCRAEAWEESDLVYVPYFGGHDSLRHMHKDPQTRDRLGHELVKLLRSSPTWARRNGSDHFLVLGRNLWDYNRTPGNHWGSDFLRLDGVHGNMWAVVVESWAGIERVVSAPKPTGFHPQTWAQVQAWQAFVGDYPRSSLFTLVGGGRGLETEEGAVRQALFWQCHRSPGECSLLNCTKNDACLDVNKVYRQYLGAKFCLHPRGDACSRRSVLDAALAGCIPVVFKGCTLDAQFEWHLGADKREFSVFIDQKLVKGPPELDNTTWPVNKGDTWIADVLRAIPEERVEAMRERVIELIPSLICGGTPQGDTILPPDFKDSVEVIIEGLARTQVQKQDS